MNIWIAAADNQIDKVKHFIETGLSANAKDENGYTPLHAAAEYGRLELIEYLVGEGADVNIRDNDGDTPLHATESSNVAEILVRLGADVRTRNLDGLTPLEKALEEQDFPELIEYLRKANGENFDERPDNMDVSVSYTSSDISEEVDESQRLRLREVVENGTDKDLEDFLASVVGKASEDGSLKKSRKS